jgi:hypothetical protein
MGPKVFISYRREEAAGHARPVYEAMVKRYGPRNVFMDLDLRPGEHWGPRIEQTAEACDVVLAIIGPRWAKVTRDDGTPRLQDPADWVRREVEAGLRRPDVLVVPVLVGDARVPDASELPDSLQPLLGRQAQHLNDQSFNHDLERLVDALPEPWGPNLLPGIVAAFAVALLASWLVGELMPAPADQSTKAEAIAVSVLRRAESWALVAAALVTWLALAARGPEMRILRSALAGLFVGALGGAAGGLVDSIPLMLDQDRPAWLDYVALAVTGAIVGALIGRNWAGRRGTLGLVLGVAGAVLAEAAVDSATNPGQFALRATLIVGLVLGGLATRDLLGRLAAERGQQRMALPRARVP